MYVSLSKSVDRIDIIVEHIRVFMRRTHGRPQFMGDISREIGWSLERTEQFLREMPDVRTATAAEKALIDAPHDSNLFVLK